MKVQILIDDCEQGAVLTGRQKLWIICFLSIHALSCMLEIPGITEWVYPPILPAC